MRNGVQQQLSAATVCACCNCVSRLIHMSMHAQEPAGGGGGGDYKERLVRLENMFLQKGIESAMKPASKMAALAAAAATEVGRAGHSCMCCCTAADTTTAVLCAVTGPGQPSEEAPEGQW